MVFIPVKRGEVLGVSTPAEFVNLVDRPNALVRSNAVARDAQTLDAWLDEWVYGVKNRAEKCQSNPASTTYLKAINPNPLAA